MTLQEKLDLATKYVQSVLQMFAPKRTGNLAFNSIRELLDFKTPSRSVIGIGGEIAPYAVYTNEKWISPRWSGRSNPNENWIQRAIYYARGTVEMIMSGEITGLDLTPYQEAINKQLEELIVKNGLGLNESAY